MTQYTKGILNTPETLPNNVTDQRNFEWHHSTAQADCVIGTINGTKVLSVIYIMNEKEGNGKAGELMRKLDGYARQCRCKEIWYPTVLNPRLLKYLIKDGYVPHTEIDDKMGAPVEIMRKVFAK